MAPIAKRTYGHIGIRKGEAYRFIRGHASRVMTDETRAKMSAAQRKLMADPERRAAVGRVHRGKTISLEHRAAVSAGSSGERNGNWRGGKHRHAAGYIFVRVGEGHPMANPRGYALEHRMVMARHLGRMLDSAEIVHHINRIKDDNRIENLQLFASHAEHVKHHTALRHAEARAAVAASGRHIQA